jgi:ATP-binding cassette subfamily C protein LapB
MRSKSHLSKNTMRAPPIGGSVLLATFALNLLALALPLVVLQIFDRVIPFQASETLFFLFAGLCVVVLLEFTLKTARTVLLGSTGKEFESRLCHQFMTSTLNADPDEFSKTTPAAHLDRFGAIAQLRGYYAGQGRILAIDLPFTAMFVVMIGLIGGWLVLVPLSCMALLLFFKTILQTAQSSIFEKRRVLDGRRYSFLVEALSQIKALKANTMEPQILRRYELLQNQTTDISHRIIKFTGLSQSFGALFSQLAVAAMGLFGSYLIITKHIGIAELAACMLLNGRTVQPMLKALGLWVQSENILAATAKFQEACSIEKRHDAPSHISVLNGRVSFEKAGLLEPESSAHFFRNIDVTLPLGDCLVVSARRPGNKLRFLKLILGEISPSEGKVLIDGKPSTEFLTTRGRGGIVYVDHSPVVFAGTVLENISSFGNGDAIDLALDLSVQLGIEKFIHRLPLGYNTQVLSSLALTNNRAAMQGISLVRALSLQPKILLINNIGAALDERAKTALENFVRNAKGKTTLIIADDTERFNQVADQILDLDRTGETTIQMWQADAEADVTGSEPLLPSKTPKVA